MSEAVFSRGDGIKAPGSALRRRLRNGPRGAAIGAKVLAALMNERRG